VLAASVPIIRPVILSLGPPSFFALTLVGLTFIIALAGKNVVRGFLMACFGFVVGMVGLDSSTGIPRYTFGQLDLWDGIGLVPLVVGLFGGAEVLQLMLSKRSVAQVSAREDTKVTGVLLGAKDAFRHWWLAIRSSGIGVGLGVVPGMGGSVAQFIAYGHAQATSKSPETFGKGNIEGVIAAGANNNAKDSGSLIPTIAFGIPGSVGTAVLLGAFLVAGVTPGTEMLTTQLPLTMSMVWVMVLANLLAVAVAFVALRPLAKLTYIRGTLLVPFLLVLLGLGAYTSSNSYFSVYVMLAASAVGVLALRYDWPRVPFLLAVILGAIAERYLFLSVSLSGWSWLNDPIVLVLFAISALAILRPVIKNQLARRRVRAARRGDGPPPSSGSVAPGGPAGSGPAGGAPEAPAARPAADDDVAAAGRRTAQDVERRGRS
jgi:putative tricarboxylic transport membrane protein